MYHGEEQDLHQEYELTIWEGDYGIPSIDTNSLIIYAYLKCFKVNCKINYCTNPLFGAIPNLTILDSRGRQMLSKTDINNFTHNWLHFRLNELPDLDSNLPNKEKFESRIYLSYIEDSIMPGIYITMWLDDQNYIEVTRKYYRNSMWFPLNLIYPWLQRNTAITYLKSLVPEENLEEYSSLLMDRAKLSLSVLSAKLGDRNYFYGDRINTLDIVVYAHLAPLLNAPYPSSQLQIALKEHDNLCKHIRRINSTLFPQTKVEYKYVSKLQEEDPEFKSSPGLLVAAILCASSAMIGYGIITGVFQISKSY